MKFFKCVITKSPKLVGKSIYRLVKITLFFIFLSLRTPLKIIMRLSMLAILIIGFMTMLYSSKHGTLIETLPQLALLSVITIAMALFSWLYDSLLLWLSDNRFSVT